MYIIEVKSYWGTTIGRYPLGKCFANNDTSIQIIFNNKWSFTEKTPIFAFQNQFIR